MRNAYEENKEGLRLKEAERFDKTSKIVLEASEER